MGRIKSMPIKTMGNDLIRLFPGNFGTDFDKNKKALSEIADFRFKRTRNTILGYITNEMTKIEKSKGRPRRRIRKTVKLKGKNKRGRF